MDFGGLDTEVRDFAHASRVKKKIRAIKARRRIAAMAARPLLEWVPALSPEFEAPTWLQPVVDVLEKARTEIVRMCMSVPPGHGKSQLLHHWIALRLAENPALRIGYGTYDKTFAEENVASIRALCGRAKVAIGKVDKAGLFTTRARGRVMGFSMQKPPTGRRFDILVVDDPYASRAEVESPVLRKKIGDGFSANLMTRQPSTGMTVIVLHTRWHIADLIGELAKGGWLYINIPAVDPKTGAYLRPGLASMVEDLRKLSEYDFASLMMGSPVPAGGTIFSEAVALVDDFPKEGAWIYVCGIDIARGKKQVNDPHSYLLTRRPAGTFTRTPTVDFLDWLEETGPIADVKLLDEKTGRKIEKLGFLRHLVRIRGAYPGVVFCMYLGRTEDNMLDLMESTSLLQERLRQAENEQTTKALASAGVHIEPMPAQGLELWNRAEAGLSPAWNGGRIRLPRHDPRTLSAIERFKNFTGGSRAVDHLISAAASAYDWHATKWTAPVGTGPLTTGAVSETTRFGIDRI